jgi:hypothetical protein
MQADIYNLGTAFYKLINQLMLSTTQDYINTFVDEQADISSLSMYATDVQHNTNALVQFNKDLNVQKLHDSIMQQDTLVREYYIEVLRYIENNNLIPANRFCCI